VSIGPLFDLQIPRGIDHKLGFLLWVRWSLGEPVALAQTGAIQGTVTDKSGAVVQVLNDGEELGTNEVRTVTTGDRRLQLSHLPSGTRDLDDEDGLQSVWAG